MNLTVDIQCASDEPVPAEDDIRGWVAAALAGAGHASDTEICLRLVDIPEMSELNRAWRDRQGPTNVLSFPAGLPAELGLPLLGDIVICVPVVQSEAAAQAKTAAAHWAHMVVHGTLHLLGHDHIAATQADVMEALERDILAGLGYPCPYEAGTERERATG